MNLLGSRADRAETTEGSRRLYHALLPSNSLTFTPPFSKKSIRSILTRFSPAHPITPITMLSTALSSEGVAPWLRQPWKWPCVRNERE